MRDTFVKTLCLLAKQDSNIILLAGDVGYEALDPFIDKYPNQFINTGIALQNMIGVATGLSLLGKKVFVYSLGNFPTLRCLLQIRNGCAYHKTNVNIISTGGLSYGKLGMSHHTTEDLSIMRALPNIIVAAPGDPRLVEMVIKYVHNIDLPAYIRLGKGGGPVFHTNQLLIKNDIIMIKLKENINIISTSNLLLLCISVVKLISNIGLFSCPIISPINKLSVLLIIQDTKILISVLLNNLNGGFGSALSEIITDSSCKVKLIRIGLNNTYTEVVGDYNFLKNYYGISKLKILKKIQLEIKLYE